MTDENPNESFRIRRPGGEVDRSRVFNAPGIVTALALSFVAVFVLLLFAPPRLAFSLEVSAALIPTRFLAGPGSNGVLSMVSPLIAHMFLHANFMHLLTNSFFLLAFGAPVARRMGADSLFQSATGFAASAMFLSFFLLSGVFGALFFVLINSASGALLVGASGGVSGLLGGLVRFAFNRTTILGPEYAKFSPLTAGPVIAWTSFILLTNNPISSAVFGAMFGGVQIAWEAHLGGYFFGLLTYPFFEKAARGLR